MVRLIRLIGDAAYWLGVVSLVAGLLLRVLAATPFNLVLSARGGLILASCLFLCSLASREMAKAG